MLYSSIAEPNLASVRLLEVIPLIICLYNPYPLRSYRNHLHIIISPLLRSFRILVLHSSHNYRHLKSATTHSHQTLDVVATTTTTTTANFAIAVAYSSFLDCIRSPIIVAEVGISSTAGFAFHPFFRDFSIDYYSDHIYILALLILLLNIVSIRHYQGVPR